MRSKRQLVIYCNASAELGLGHWMRCLSIVRTFSLDDWDITFCSVESTPASLQMLADVGINHLKLDQTRRDSATLLSQLVAFEQFNLARNLQSSDESMTANCMTDNSEVVSASTLDEVPIGNADSCSYASSDRLQLSEKDILLLDDYALHQAQWDELAKSITNITHSVFKQNIAIKSSQNTQMHSSSNPKFTPQIVLLNDDIEHSSGFTSPWVDWVINPAPNVKHDDYVQRFPNALTLLGPAYAYLRPEFSSVKYIPLQKRTGILIMLGGSDVKNLSAPLAKAIATILPGITITLVLGAATKWENVLSETITEQFPQITVYQNTPKIPELMMQSGLAITAAGGTLGELAAMGVPTIALVIAENQVTALSNEHEGKWYKAFDFREYNAVEDKSEQPFSVDVFSSVTASGEELSLEAVSSKGTSAEMTSTDAFSAQTLLLETTTMAFSSAEPNSTLATSTESSVPQTAKTLWYDLCKRKEMSAYARQLIDTKGCQRIMLNIGQTQT